MPLSFELGGAFRFDWSDEGLESPVVCRRVQLAHMKLYALRSFCLIAYPSQGHEMVRPAGRSSCRRASPSVERPLGRPQSERPVFEAPTSPYRPRTDSRCPDLVALKQPVGNQRGHP